MPRLRTLKQFFSNPLTEQQQRALDLARARNHIAEVQAFLYATEIHSHHTQTARAAADFLYTFLQGLMQRENERES